MRLFEDSKTKYSARNRWKMLLEALNYDKSHDYYADLRVPRNASAADLKKALRAMQKKFHPDNNIGNEEWADKVFTAAQTAYDVLTTSRAAYDSDNKTAGTDKSESWNKAMAGGFDKPTRENEKTKERQEVGKFNGSDKGESDSQQQDSTKQKSDEQQEGGQDQGTEQNSSEEDSSEDDSQNNSDNHSDSDQESEQEGSDKSQQENEKSKLPLTRAEINDPEGNKDSIFRKIQRYTRTNEQDFKQIPKVILQYLLKSIKELKYKNQFDLTTNPFFCFIFTAGGGIIPLGMLQAMEKNIFTLYKNIRSGNLAELFVFNDDGKFSPKGLRFPDSAQKDMINWFHNESLYQRNSVDFEYCLNAFKIATLTKYWGKYYKNNIQPETENGADGTYKEFFVNRYNGKILESGQNKEYNENERTIHNVLYKWGIGNTKDQEKDKDDSIKIAKETATSFTKLVKSGRQPIKDIIELLKKTLESGDDKAKVAAKVLSDIIDSVITDYDFKINASSILGKDAKNSSNKKTSGTKQTNQQGQQNQQKQGSK